MNHLIKTINEQIQLKEQADFFSNISSNLSVLFGFRGHLIKLNYVIFYFAGKLRKNHFVIDIINFIKRRTFASDIPYHAFAYGKDFSFLCFYNSIVRFAYGKDLSINTTDSFLHPYPRLITGKQDTILTTNRKLGINRFISLFIAVAKRSDFAPLLHLFIFYTLSIPVIEFIFVAIFLHQPFLLPIF